MSTHTASKPCSCHECQPPPPSDCCQLQCPESPRYFSGHLLSDADLSLEQKYHRDKHQLYHRALHGTGVVCGLGLTCAPDCEGAIRVAPGFAIDDCGHDLIVCQPYSFDVLKALEKMNLYTPPEEHHDQDACDPCDEKGAPTGGCDIKRCFPVAICYKEQSQDLVVPFALDDASCSRDCEPSRTLETVCVELLLDPPKKKTWGDRLAEKLEDSVQVLREGLFAEKLREYRDYLASGKATIGGLKDYFCQLHKLFRLHLQRCPDAYQCSAPSEFCKIKLPDDANEKLVRDKIEELISFAEKYAASRLLGQLVPDCSGPCQPACVVIGTVEVNLSTGQILHVCNCPRQYVWTLAHLPEILLGWLASFFGCQPGQHETPGMCCSADYVASFLGGFFKTFPPATPTRPPANTGLRTSATPAYTTEPKTMTPFDTITQALRQVAGVGSAGPDLMRAFASLQETFSQVQSHWPGTPKSTTSPTPVPPKRSDITTEIEKGQLLSDLRAREDEAVILRKKSEDIQAAAKPNAAVELKPIQERQAVVEGTISAIKVRLSDIALQDKTTALSDEIATLSTTQSDLEKKAAELEEKAKTDDSAKPQLVQIKADLDQQRKAVEAKVEERDNLVSTASTQASKLADAARILEAAKAREAVKMREDAEIAAATKTLEEADQAAEDDKAKFQKQLKEAAKARKAAAAAATEEAKPDPTTSKPDPDKTPKT